MIQVRLSDKSFQYDIHSLIKAFYPREEIIFPGFEGNDNEDSSEAEPDEIHIEINLPDHSLSLNLPYREDGLQIDRKSLKSDLKRELYDLLENETGKSLPWGTLTGIRPVKLSSQGLIEGKSDADILAFLKSFYYISDEKAKLSLEIAKREAKVLSKRAFHKGYSLYINIPFCPTTCLYCSFASYSIQKFKAWTQDYLRALSKEIDFLSKLKGFESPDTVYIGGGTPTALSAKELEGLLTELDSKINLSNLSEFTVEAGRPDSITPEKLAILKKFSVDRISVNPQTMLNRTLKLIGRQHTAEDTMRAFNEARTAGFDNINMDIILGLPGEGLDDVKYTLEKISGMQPDDLTVHSLALKRGSALKALAVEGENPGIETSTAEMEGCMAAASDSAREMGLFPYYLYRQKNIAGNLENTGFSKPEKEGIYNILMIEDVGSIMALGAGAISKRVFPDGQIRRVDAVKDLKLYLEQVDQMIDRKRLLFE